MHFLPDPDPPAATPAAEPPFWRWLLFASAAAAAFGATLPWIRVQFERLFGEHQGPPGWHSSAGFTCLCTSLLVVVMALGETGSTRSRQAVRPGSLMLVGVAALALLFEWWNGPGMLRGVSARWTGWFYLACTGLPVLLATCAVRWAALPRRLP
ncbi:MAG TPA: hypothetical protein VFZ65_00280 [Planctomycetota bacterium]|nr:hypothetical protein [Planctomycetota bacterium]